MPNADSWVVLKFGGTSVATRSQWDTIASLVRRCQASGEKPLVVASALDGTQDQLWTLIRSVRDGGGDQEKGKVWDAHVRLAKELGVDGEPLLAPHMQDLERLLLGIGLTAESSPATSARVLSTGELMISRLGAAFLESQGLPITWLDARTVLRSVNGSSNSVQGHFLAATCSGDPDVELQRRLAGCSIVLTQGQLASNEHDQTVRMGCGGADTSAACFAARLQASRMEIWTDVPGMFTTDPRKITSARLLHHLDYEEARELASTGADVLHPRCVDPLREHHIPLYVRCTDTPHLAGTKVADDVPGYGAQVKAISMRRGITLIAIETPRMWHQVGFLAKAFAIFERCGLSIGHVATSESSITVSIDPVQEVDYGAVDAAVHALGAFCRVRPIEPCASVSLVGRHLRSVLHELGPALEVLDEQRVLLVTQAASDLNFSFVVQERHADRLVKRLHNQVFGNIGAQDPFGPTYRELLASEEPVNVRPWWRRKYEELLALDTPSFVYDTATLRERSASVRDLPPIDRAFYAMKACSHPGVLRVFYREGLGFECVSPGELDLIHQLFPDIAPERILFTPNFAPRHEYSDGFDRAGYVTLDSLRPLELWPNVFANREVIVRVDPGRGQGHHRHVRTAGSQTKFGIAPSRLSALKALARDIGLNVSGLHAHVGSGILTPETWPEVAFFLGSLLERFPDVRHLNIGGGLGVPERPGVLPLNLEILSERLSRFKESHPQLELWMEPGRYFAAEAGVLLARVTQVKWKGARCYIGIETGMNSLIRPALYGSHHFIVNLTRIGEPAAMTADIVGPICETGDVLGHGRRLPRTREGDMLLVANAGAYGRVMSSAYNCRNPATETLLA